MFHVTLSSNAHDMHTSLVGKYTRRKDAFREAKRAAGFKPELIQRGQDIGYLGENGMAWIVE